MPCYKFIIQEMVWSYSRLKTFEDCPYGWLEKYVYKGKTNENFFASYGSFIHKIMKMYLTGQLKKEELVSYYISKFHDEIVMDPPSNKILSHYFLDGITYLKSPNIAATNVLAVERQVNYKVGKFNFTGFLDVLHQENKLILTDHKSRNLRPYSLKDIPTKQDKELSDYFKQLYLYSIPIKDVYGKYPDVLQFNCFRTKTLISSPFLISELEKTIKWAETLISKICENTVWNPCQSYFKCRYICDVRDSCKYFADHMEEEVRKHHYR